MDVSHRDPPERNYSERGAKRIGATFWATRARLFWAEQLAKRGDADEAERAKRLFGQASDAAQTLGAPALLEPDRGMRGGTRTEVIAPEGCRSVLTPPVGTWRFGALKRSKPARGAPGSHLRLAPVYRGGVG